MKVVYDAWGQILRADELAPDYVGIDYGYGSYTATTNCIYGQSYVSVVVPSMQTTATTANTILSQWYTIDGTNYAETARLACEKKWQEDDKARRERARAALLLLLDEEQKKQLETEKCFELCVGDRLYRVRPGARVERLDPKSKKIQSYFCIHPEHKFELPAEDVAISQKLLLETNEVKFLQIANETKAA